MARKLVRLNGASALFVGFALWVPAEARADGEPVVVPVNPQLVVPTPARRSHAIGVDHKVPCKRGVAILSPIESPDFYDPPVGGKTIYTPYYPDFCPDRWRGPRVAIPGNGVGYLGPGLGVPCPTVDSIEATAAGPKGYGDYSGAARNEEWLLHLGGMSTASASPKPSGSPPDLIDLLQSGH